MVPAIVQNEAQPRLGCDVATTRKHAFTTCCLLVPPTYDPQHAVCPRTYPRRLREEIAFSKSAARARARTYTHISRTQRHDVRSRP